MNSLRTYVGDPLLGSLGETVSANPRHAWIEVTDKCNTRCAHCGHFYQDFGQDMPEEIYSKIDPVALDNLQAVDLNGYGEPLIARRFWPLFDKFAAKDIPITFTSNGILLRKDEIVARIVRSNVLLALSVDGASKETFEFVRRKIKWEQMLQTLDCIHRNIVEAGKEARIYFRINVCVMRQNVAELPAMVRLGHKYGAHEVNVLPLGHAEQFPEVQGEALNEEAALLAPHYLGAMKESYRLGIKFFVPPGFLSKILEGSETGGTLATKVRRYRTILDVGFSQLRHRGLGRVVSRVLAKPTPRGPVAPLYCSRPWFDAYFASTGKVYPCCIMGGQAVGDLVKEDWSSIWNGPGYRNVRRTVHSYNPTHICRTCPLSTGINGGDEQVFTRYFSRFRRTHVPLDSPAVAWDEGAHALEFGPDRGARPTHMWISGDATLALTLPRKAKFLRVRIALQPWEEGLTAGTCEIQGLGAEPFDNSCEELHFPLGQAAAGQTKRLRFTMEKDRVYPPDTRRLGLAIKELELLS